MQIHTWPKTWCTLAKLAVLLGLGGGCPASADSRQAHRGSSDPPSLDFSNLPSRVVTNLSSYLVAGEAPNGVLVRLDGEEVPTDAAGGFVRTRALVPGSNSLSLAFVPESGDAEVLTREIVFDSEYRTDLQRLLYIDSVSPQAPGTIVIDLDRALRARNPSRPTCAGNLARSGRALHGGSDSLEFGDPHGTGIRPESLALLR